METKWGNLSLETVRSRGADLARQREWDRFHTPRNLLSALVGEVGDLSECFQWKGEVTENLEGFSEAEKVHVGEEMADVLVYLVRMADKAGIDLPSVVGRRMDLNAGEYPVDLSNGSAERYTELTDSPVETANARESGAAVDADDGQVAELARTVSVLLPSEHRKMCDLGDQGLVADSDCFFDYGWLANCDAYNRVASFIVDRARALLGHRPKVFIDISWSRDSHLYREESSFLIDVSRRIEAFDAVVVVDGIPRWRTFDELHEKTDAVNRRTRMGDGTVLQDHMYGYCPTKFFAMDILDEETPEKLLESIRGINMPPCYPIVHGTVALNEIYHAREKRLAELDGFVSHVRRLFKGRYGLFIVTSGFLSESELLTLFKAPFQLRARLRHADSYFPPSRDSFYPPSRVFAYEGSDHPHSHVTLCFQCSAQ